jgi:hypothetical protein
MSDLAAPALSKPAQALRLDQSRPAAAEPLMRGHVGPDSAPVSWLISDGMDRERMLDMDRLVAPVRQKSFVVMSVALLLCGPWLGWWTIALLAVAGVLF